MHYMYHSVFIPYLHYIFIWASSCMICIYFSAYHFKHFNKFIDFNIFYDNYTSRSRVGGLDSAIYTMSQYSRYYGLFLFNSQITVFMTLPGILTV